jgi:hypothetical protein
MRSSPALYSILEALENQEIVHYHGGRYRLNPAARAAAARLTPKIPATAVGEALRSLLGATVVHYHGGRYRLNPAARAAAARLTPKIPATAVGEALRSLLGATVVHYHGGRYRLSDRAKQALTFLIPNPSSATAAESPPDNPPEKQVTTRLESLDKSRKFPYRSVVGSIGILAALALSLNLRPSPAPESTTPPLPVRSAKRTSPQSEKESPFSPFPSVFPRRFPGRLSSFEAISRWATDSKLPLDLYPADGKPRASDDEPPAVTVEQMLLDTASFVGQSSLTGGKAPATSAPDPFPQFPSTGLDTPKRPKTATERRRYNDSGLETREKPGSPVYRPVESRVGATSIGNLSSPFSSGASDAISSPFSDRAPPRGESENLKSPLSNNFYLDSLNPTPDALAVPEPNCSGKVKILGFLFFLLFSKKRLKLFSTR